MFPQSATQLTNPHKMKLSLYYASLDPFAFNSMRYLGVVWSIRHLSDNTDSNEWHFLQLPIVVLYILEAQKEKMTMKRRIAKFSAVNEINSQLPSPNLHAVMRGNEVKTFN